MSTDLPTHDCREGTHVVADHSEQGWRRMCDGVIVFDDGGCLTPDGRVVRPGQAA